MGSERRPILFLLIALVTLAGAMTVAVRAQRDAAADAADQHAATTRMLVQMFDVDSALRGYVLTGDKRAIAPYEQAKRSAARSIAHAESLMGGDGASARHVATAKAAMARWQRAAEARIAEVRTAGPSSVNLPNARARRIAQNTYRTELTALEHHLDEQRDVALRRAGAIATAAIVLLVLLFGVAGYLLIRRGSRLREQAIAHELRYRESDREFTDVVQAVASEDEADAVLKRHLERSIAGATVTVLKSNSSDNRLEAATPVPSGSPLCGGLRGAQPRDCVAVRLAQPHADGAETDGLLTCRICGSVRGRSDCRPLLVGGRVIGSVLAEHPAELDDDERRAFRESVARAAPVLANLQAITVAESQAATDALTGLANRRAINDTMRQMAAHASRSVQPLALIAMDVDHFKNINDRYGHDAGDTVLAAVGEILRTATRESDVPGRLGGEEFVVLAPDTNVDGAEILAEKLREAIYRAEIPGIDESITASFGVGVLPDDAHTPELLLRRADRALYLAKELGRNRVELVRSVPE